MLKPRPSQFKDPGQYSILIVCEDKKSAVYYLEAKRKECGLSTTATIEKLKSEEGGVDIEGGKGVPISIVNCAIDKRNEYNERAKKLGIYPYKKVYCVMDVDEHPKLTEAVDKIYETNRASAESELIHIISNECFEIWYVLHFEYTTRELSRASSRIPSAEYRLDKVLEQHLGIEDYEKSEKGIFDLIKKNEAQSILHAEKLEKYHQTVSPPPVYLCNPSTEVYKLIVELNRLKHARKPINPHEIGDITQQDLKDCVRFFRDDEFTKTMIALINECYPGETKHDKAQLLEELFSENPYKSRSLVEYPEKIAGYFYQNYQSWKESTSLAG